MDSLNSLYVAGSALTAERLRMDVIANNLANVETASTPQGGPYKRQMVVFQPIENAPGHDLPVPTMGVEVTRIVQDSSPPRRAYEPNSPLAGTDGFVSYPNVDLSTEMVDLMAASRAYQANAAVVQDTKDLVNRTIDLGRA